MLAPRELPKQFAAWNRRHGAPNGYLRNRRRCLKSFIPQRTWQRWLGPFSIQSNNPTRTHEYPWAFQATELRAGMRVLEIGGGLCGLQFVLDRAGCEVINIDPGLEAGGLGWPVNEESLNDLNDLFNSEVTLINKTIDRAGLRDESFDRAFAVSVLEHLPEDELREVMMHTFRALKPAGLFVNTLDLFLNLDPFTSRLSNEYGRNQDVAQLTDMAPFELVEGNKAELYGFDEFDSDLIQSRLEQFMIGSYPVLTQCMVLRKSKS